MKTLLVPTIHRIIGITLKSKPIPFRFCCQTTMPESGTTWAIRVSDLLCCESQCDFILPSFGGKDKEMGEPTFSLYVPLSFKEIRRKGRPALDINGEDILTLQQREMEPLPSFEALEDYCLLHYEQIVSGLLGE